MFSYHNNRKRKTVLQTASLLLLLMFSGISVSAEKPQIIRIVLSKSGPIYDRFAASFISHVHKSRPSIPVEVRVLSGMDLEHDLKTPPSLYIPVGIKATKALVVQKSGIPVIAALVPHESYNTLRLYGSDSCRNSTRCSAIVLDQPAGRQLDLARALFGNKIKVGALVGSENDRILEAYVNDAARIGVAFETGKVSSESRIVSSLISLLDRVDVLLALPDPLVFNPNTVKHVLLTTYRHKKPLIAFSPGYVKAGALAAIYSSPENAAQDLVSWLEKGWFSGKAVFPEYIKPESYSIELNQRVAESLRIKLPSETRIRQFIDKRSRK